MSSKKESSRVLTVYYTYLNGEERRPLIRLQGKWLQDFGFQSGDKIEVEGNNGSLLIKNRTRRQV